MRKHDVSSAASGGSLRLTQRWCLLLYACLTALCLIVHNRLVDSASLDARRDMHAEVIANTGPAPLQYRVATFYLAEGLQRAGRALGFEQPFKASYVILRGLFTFLAAFLLHRFLLGYFALPVACFGVVLSFAWLPMTYINYYMQESDPLNYVFFLGGYLLIRKRRDLALAVLVPLAMLNRETPVLLPLVWLLYRWDEMSPARAALASAGYGAAALAVYFVLRFALGHHAAYAEFNDFQLNLQSFNSYFYFAVLFGALAVPALRGLDGKPKFLRRAALFLPFFLVFHFVIPIFQETRLFLPIFPIVLALALCSLADVRPEAVAEEERPAASPLAGKARALLVAAFVAFVAAMFGYLRYLEKAHVADLHDRRRSEGHIKEGFGAFDAGDFTTAAREWEWALLYDPDNYEVHYNAAVAYADHLFDVEKARAHLAVCARLFPDDPKRKALEAHLDDLQNARRRAVQEGR